jgi:hypothetical protein
VVFMNDLERRAWLLERFGTDGARLRAAFPGMLWACHIGMAEAQESAPIRAQSVYGEIWRAVHEGLEEACKSLATVQLYRPPRAPYKVPVIGGTAVFPWRFAKDAVTDLDHASFGPRVSATRQAVLSGVELPEMLPFGGLSTVDDGTSERDAEEIERYRAAFRATVARHPVVVLAYASNPRMLLSGYWGDSIRLRTDGTLEWGAREQLDLTRPTQPPGRRLAVVSDDTRPNFQNAPLRPAVVRPRRKASDAPRSSEGPGGRVG